MGAQALAQGAKPDGYTIAQMPITVFRLPHMMKANFDPMQDFTWIIHLTGYTFGVVVRADSPLQDLGDVIAYAKANPGKLTYATPGNGTSLHITMENIARATASSGSRCPSRATPTAPCAAGRPRRPALGFERLGRVGERRQAAPARHLGPRSAPSAGPKRPTLKELGYRSSPPRPTASPARKAWTRR
jgi:tripartite-type tricarboxylate transporter receptor subunit TctC